ncbi:TonB-dependent receptor domain-containing protein [Dokdonella sp.]|uniref:TonB-dependent receptor domain-containing protein n=1 Tax=Dokdonella sp. TaxID=2291710 RepID=UPI003C7051E6
MNRPLRRGTLVAALLLALSPAVAQSDLALVEEGAEDSAARRDTLAEEELEAGTDDLLPADDPGTVELRGVEVQGKVGNDNEVLYLDEKRASPEIVEALSSEQIARTGDSDVATTLKRVPGLSVVNGRYVYVRGLGERYSSVLLNGAQIPSPDFTRRVVPLDLFPTELLDGIIVQKTYSPNLPGEFGGGAVILRTREAPQKPFFRIQGTIGYTAGTTFQDGLSYEGGDSDWTGSDDGTRALPGSLEAAISGGNYLRPASANNPGGATPEQLQQYGQDLAESGFGIGPDRIGPDGGLSIGLGNSFQLSDDVRLGLIGAFRYNQDWDSVAEVRSIYANSNSGLTQVGNLEIDLSGREVDSSAFIGANLDLGRYHRIGLTLLDLRQTQDLTRISDGIVDSVDSSYYEMRWTENELIAGQLIGTHMFPDAHDLEIHWQYTHSDASRDQPNRRTYRYDRADDVLEYSRRSDANASSFGELDDSQNDYAISGVLPFYFDSGSSLLLSGGLGRTTRNRDSSIRTFSYLLASGSPLNSEPGFFAQPIDQILTAANIGPEGFVLREVTRPTDNYFADQAIDSYFLNAELDLGMWRVSAGARHESNTQSVTTFDVGSSSFDPIISSDDSDIWLPALAVTWAYSDAAQLRFAYSKTLSRPDFRELSPAPYTDPDLDIDTIGDPDLLSTRIQNLDLRWEYYFGGADTFAIALFQKKFDNPIEKLRIPGSTPLLQLSNALSADNYGVEVDLQKNLGFVGERWLESLDTSPFDVGFNYTRVKSSIELDTESAGFQTNLSRPMQGQSPYVVNLNFGYTSERNEANLLWSRFGSRISEVGVQGQPDVYEESYNSLDFIWRHFINDNWRTTFRLRNLLDSEVRFTQGGLDTRLYQKGREVLFSLEWRPLK